jgi:hypothetical protein
MNWIQGVALGPIATTIGIIAVAAIGFALLTGRIDLRRGVAVVLGCFMIFGARGIAEALAVLAAGSGTVPRRVEAPPPLTVLVAPSQPYDPYAGASVPQ